MSKHTPGPWEIHGEEIHSAYHVLGVVYGAADTYCDEASECKANAHLIAAAPELLAFIECWENEITDGGILDKLQGWQREFAEEARAVLAKAKGERPCVA